MTTHTPTTEKKKPMSTTAPYQNTPNQNASYQNPTTSTNRSRALHLINEALSRARMRSPQNANSEARRSARRIAIQARKQQAREMGNIAQTYSLR